MWAEDIKACVEAVGIHKIISLLSPSQEDLLKAYEHLGSRYFALAESPQGNNGI